MGSSDLIRPLLTGCLSFTTAGAWQTGSLANALQALEVIVSLNMRVKNHPRSGLPLLAIPGLVDGSIPMEVPVNGGRRNRSGA